MVQSQESNQCIILRFLTTTNRYDSITTVVPNSQLGIGPKATFQHALLCKYIENMYWGAKRRKADMRTLEWFVMGIGGDKKILKTGHVVDQRPIPGMVVDLDQFDPEPHALPGERAPMSEVGDGQVEAKYELVIAPALPFEVEEAKPVAKPEPPRWTPPWQS